GSGCPQLHRPAATGSAAKVSHLHSNHSASRRTHDLRHTAASIMIAAGIPLAVVSKTLRHANLAITVDLYGHLLKDSADEAVVALAAALDRADAHCGVASIGAGPAARRLPEPTPARRRTDAVYGSSLDQTETQRMAGRPATVGCAA
ncbi:tyrosine-type recombinase/integrase, partial [Kitasatospora sp. NPDC056446]|uniref:tyrosine-type recombinase/integrase n=1 Tax=Kitasatospora sp. NPDC056446 TaxID=3345819 RepID=UPI00368FC590